MIRIDHDAKRLLTKDPVATLEETPLLTTEEIRDMLRHATTNDATETPHTLPIDAAPPTAGSFPSFSVDFLTEVLRGIGNRPVPAPRRLSTHPRARQPPHMPTPVMRPARAAADIAPRTRDPFGELGIGARVRHDQHEVKMRGSPLLWFELPPTARVRPLPQQPLHPRVEMLLSFGGVRVTSRISERDELHPRQAHELPVQRIKLIFEAPAAGTTEALDRAPLRCDPVAARCTSTVRPR